GRGAHGGDDRRWHQRRPGAGTGRRRGRDEHRHARGERGGQYGRSRLESDQADRDRRDRQAAADDARGADDVQPGQRRGEVLRHHSGGVRRDLSAAREAERDAPGDPAQRRAELGHLQRADHRLPDSARSSRRALPSGGGGVVAPAESGRLRHRRSAGPVRGDQGDRSDPRGSWTCVRWSMKNHLRPVLVSLALFTVLTGFVYPLLVTGAAQVLFPKQANGSVLERDGKPVGSALIGQEFQDPKYFWGRLSGTGPVPYTAFNADKGTGSSGSSLGPSNPALRNAAEARAKALHEADPANTAPIPVDLVTASGSGLDAEISPAAAAW